MLVRVCQDHICCALGLKVLHTVTDATHSLQEYAPALSSLTGETSSTAGGSTTTSSAGGLRGTINNAVEATKEYLPPQVGGYNQQAGQTIKEYLPNQVQLSDCLNTNVGLAVRSC